MYIHVNPEDYTRKCGKYTEEYVKFDSVDSIQILSRMIGYMKAYIENHIEVYDDNAQKRIIKMEEMCDNFLKHKDQWVKGQWIKWLINDSNVQIGIKMIEWCMNWIEENNIKDRKTVNKCWAIRCFSSYWNKNFKCQGA